MKKYLLAYALVVAASCGNVQNLDTDAGARLDGGDMSTDAGAVLPDGGDLLPPLTNFQSVRSTDGVDFASGVSGCASVACQESDATAISGGAVWDPELVWTASRRGEAGNTWDLCFSNPTDRTHGVRDLSALCVNGEISEVTSEGNNLVECAQASCSGDSVLVGGGFTLNLSAGSVGSVADSARVVSSLPISGMGASPTTWRACYGREDLADASLLRVEAKAYCADNVAAEVSTTRFELTREVSIACAADFPVLAGGGAWSVGNLPYSSYLNEASNSWNFTFSDARGSDGTISALCLTENEY